MLNVPVPAEVTWIGTSNSRNESPGEDARAGVKPPTSNICPVAGEPVPCVLAVNTVP